jgi:SAM-dependent methyltransferase
VTPGCRFCGAPAATLRFHAVDANRRISADRFPYYACGACRTLFLSPAPADLGRYYPSEYYALPETADALAPMAERERYKLDLVRAAVPSGRLLEVGPGTGAFAHLAKAHGFDVDVVEMDRGVCGFLERVVGVRAFNRADVSAALADLGTYDVIALWHVIEHLPDPRETLAASADRLRPGGALVIAAPNPDALQFRILGRRWTHLDAPRHLQLIPIDALVRAAGAAGLRAEAVTTTDLGGLGWNHFGWRHSLGNLSASAGLRSRLEAAGDFANRLFWRVERRGTRGSAYTITFRKE